MAIKAGDIVFLDTNVLLSATDTGRRDHAPSNAILSNAISRGIHLAVCGQVLREYAVVATRPLEANGLGMNCKDVIRNVAMFRKVTVFFEEPEAVTDTLFDLIKIHDLKGHRIHDASIVALMKNHRVPMLVTDNTGDFRAFKDIQVLSIEGMASLLQP
jgi:predicted nucleic acid-binding protein